MFANHLSTYLTVLHSLRCFAHRLLLLSVLPGLLTVAQAQLNDSGETFSSETGADPQYGRDAAAAAGVLPKTGAGAKGFDFTKICNSGETAGSGNCPAEPALGSGANDWACTRDNVTKRVWEVKTDDGGLRDKDWTYTWYNSDATTNGGNAGLQDGGSCFEAATRDCDTKGYTDDVNATALCGFTDWRMPSREELRSIVDYGTRGPAIDTTFFSNTPSLNFWSASAFADFIIGVWNVSFSNGGDDASHRSGTYRVRLVRGGQ